MDERLAARYLIRIAGLLLQPLRTQPDYGEARRGQEQDRPNPFLNVPPTRLRRDIASETDPHRKRLMREALGVWRVSVPGPFRESRVAGELVRIARMLVGA